MGSSLSRPVRFLALLFAALQFAVPAVVSVVDGVVARHGRESPTHIEEYGQNRCTPPHPADCAMCRFLSSTHGAVATAPAPAIDQTVACDPTPVVAMSSVADRYGFQSRAPPADLD